jgi:hypothetical protein
MQKVTLHVSTETAEWKDVYYKGVEVTGEVRRGNEILHSHHVLTDDSTESVSDAKEEVALAIELWAVENTDFLPTADALPV